MVLNAMFPPLQNISKTESTKFDIFGSKFKPNTFIFVDKFFLIYFATDGVCDKTIQIHIYNA
jgi:hypothetical protein